MRICKYGIGCVSPKTAPRSNHIIICVNASPHCVFGKSKTASLPYVSCDMTHSYV